MTSRTWNDDYFEMFEAKQYLSVFIIKCVKIRAYRALSLKKRCFMQLYYQKKEHTPNHSGPCVVVMYLYG